MSIKQCLVLVIVFWTFAFSATGQKVLPVDVLVVGTIHGMHETNPHYSYHDIVRILATYKPDAVCVEIPPSYFRKKGYLKEMTLACIYGAEHGIASYPIDYWGTNYNVRAARKEYMQTEDYKNKKLVADSLMQHSAIIQQFEKKYGIIDSLWQSNTVGYEFFNGRDYNDYTREAYRIEIEVYGDGVMNLHSEARNAKMLSLIDSAITVGHAKRVIVFTGAEHKYYFDDAFAKRDSVHLVEFNEILPLQDVMPSRNETDYLEHSLAHNYYHDANVMYTNALVPLLHGPDMDMNPQAIPTQNLEKAEQLLQEWAHLDVRSASYDFERLWLNLLQRHYKEAIEVGEQLRTRINELEGWFYAIMFWRNLGFCYDMVGKRDEAVQCYTQGETVARELGGSDELIQAIFKDYKHEPFRHD